MFGFSSDAKHLVFQDGFGLTRLTLPRAVKTDRALAGGRLLTSGTIGVATRRHDRIASIALDTLEKRPWALGDMGYFAPHPNGAHCIELGSGVPSIVECSSGAKSPLSCPKDALDAGVFDLGRAVPRNQFTPNAGRVSHDGVAIVYVSNTADDPSLGALLYCVDLSDPSAPKFLWRARAQHAVGALSFEPGRAASYVRAFDPGLARAVIYRVEHGSDRVTVERCALPTAVAPAFSGERWCWIDDAGSVCSSPWGSFAAPQRWSLPAGVDARGTLMAHGGALLFAPQDGERFVDVTSKTIIARKLPAGDASMRSVVAQAQDRFDRWFAEEGGRFAFTFAERNKRTADIDCSVSWDIGAGSLSAHFALGTLLGASHETREAGERLVISGCSGGQGLSRTELDDVRRAFAALDARGAPLLRACQALGFPLERWYEPPSKDSATRGLAAPERAFSAQAATVLLRAIFEQCASRGRVDLARNVDAWAAQPWTAASLASQRFVDDPYAHPQIMDSSSVPFVLGFLAQDLLGAEALPTLSQWLVVAPATYFVNSVRGAGVVAARMIQYHPETEQAFVAACEQCGPHGANVLQSVRQILR